MPHGQGGKEDAALLLEELMRRLRDPQHSPIARIFSTASS
jgi:proline dehydrogenase